MAEEYTTMRDLGFDFGPDPFGDKAAAAAISAFVHKPGFSYMLAVMGACVAYWVYVMLREAGVRRDSVTIAKGNEAQNILRREGALRELRARDPGFEEALFLEKAKEMFLKVQGSMSRRQPGLVRACVSDGMYERLRDELDRTGAAGVRDKVEDVEVKDILALGYATGAHYDSISVGYKIAAVRERIDERTKARLDGGQAEYEEVWTFLRRPTAKTLKGPGAMEGLCPSCGAPLNITDAARCEACKAWINSGEFDWILADSTAPWEWRFPDPRREITGWNDLREDDPNLSLEALEDRTAVAFWRWIAQRRREGRAAEAHLGAVETVAFQPGPEEDEVHVQVRWEDGRQRRTDYFIFARAAGSATNWKAGLSATRCAACGAAVESADAAACAYCGERTGWRLARIEAFGEWKRPAEAPATLVLPGCEWGDLVPVEAALGALALLAAADGAVHDREVAYLSAYAGRRGFPTAKAEALIAQARDGKLDFPMTHETGEAVLRGLIRMSLADGFIETSERELLSKAARRAGLHELELKEMIKTERAALAAKARVLIARLG
ncbi:MAG: TIM44-like domain-containing protein [Elusimicrobia bacterium]|nr:TIM44-like domain-containing protein [Elusimicrobiota bacterium]